MKTVLLPAPPAPLPEYALVDDAGLVLASLVGDGRAFDELLRRYQSAVILAAQQTGLGRAAAEDVAQDAFLIAFQTLPNLDDPARFGGWLRAIARFRALRVRERERKSETTEAGDLETLAEHRRHSDAFGGSFTGDADNPESRHLRGERNDAVWGALDRLSPDHREVLYLHYCEEWPLARIAAFLTLTETTVKGRLFRAREALRRLLKPDYEADRKG